MGGFVSETDQLCGDRRRPVGEIAALVVLAFPEQGSDGRGCHHSDAMSTDAEQVKLGVVPPMVSTTRT